MGLLLTSSSANSINAMKLLNILLASITTLAASANAAVLALYDFTGATGDQISQAPFTTATNVIASDITRGPGLNANAGGGSINASGWAMTPTIDLDDYFGFTIQPVEGFTLDVSSLSFAERRSGTGIRDISIRTSLDGYASDVFTTNVEDDTLTRDQSYAFGAAFDNITDSLTIRVYGYSAESAAGTWRLTNHSTDLGLVIMGSVTAVPEPSTYAAMLGLVVVGLAIVRRRK